MLKRILIATAFLTIVTSAAAAIDRVATQAAAGDSEAIAALRAQGQPGLDRLLALRPDPLKKPDPLLADAIDQVAMQKDAWASGLYWYTDLDAAKRVAAMQGKPILSLRLLGHLNEELSCANSRFFRTVLYADPKVQQVLQSRFVLHWQSVRPVPVVTIDFGDGRVLRRTVTGNSIHYVLAPDGTVLDALPGLYSSREFTRQLGFTLELVRDWATSGSLQVD